MQSNVDQNEINKFSELASQWWDLEGKLKTLHQINPLRLRFIAQNSTLKNARVLDVGTGGGILAEALAQAGALVTGIDLSRENIKVAKLHQIESQLNIDYQVISVEALSQTHSGQFDIITCMELLEHVPSPQSIINACAKLTRPGGHLFFSTLNRNLKSYLFAILGAEYILQLLPKNTHEFKKFIRPSELCAWLHANHLKAQSMQGIEYHPLNKTFSLSKDISINYLLHAIKP